MQAFTPGVVAPWSNRLLWAKAPEQRRQIKVFEAVTKMSNWQDFCVGLNEQKETWPEDTNHLPTQDAPLSGGNI